MKIVYFYQFFSTPKGSWGTRVYEFTKKWVEQGHQVTVVTNLFAKSDLQAKKFIETQFHDGIRVKVLKVRLDNKHPMWKRVLTFLQYAFVSSWYALTLPADVVVASSGPITAGLPGLVARYLKRRKLVFEVRDLWPDGAIELGIIRNPLIKRFCYFFEKRCYKAASLVVALSPGMKHEIEKKSRHPNVISVTNAANIEMFSTRKPFDECCGILPYTYAIYTGNIGRVNNSRWLYDAAKILKQKGRDDIKIVLIGEGQWREELETLAREENTSNFIRWGLMPKEDLVPFIQYSLASLVPLKGAPILDTSSPNKFFESLAAGVPVIQNTNGWMKDFLLEYNLGYTLKPNDPDGLANLLIKLNGDASGRDDFAKRSIALARREFDKDILADKMLKEIIKVGEGK